MTVSKSICLLKVSSAGPLARQETVARLEALVTLFLRPAPKKLANLLIASSCGLTAEFGSIFQW